MKMKLTKSKLKEIIEEELRESFMQALTTPMSFSKKTPPTPMEQAQVIADETIETLETILGHTPRDLKGKVNALNQMKDTLSRALIWGPEGKSELALTKLVRLALKEDIKNETD